MYDDVRKRDLHVLNENGLLIAQLKQVLLVLMPHFLRWFSVFHYDIRDSDALYGHRMVVFSDLLVALMQYCVFWWHGSCFFQTETSTDSFYHVCTEYQSIDGIDLN